ncbi:MAG: Holliday junction resolvase RuvX [Actinomycetota bacterium]|nr:Holliday junction resolvase RuvX [Actinomycetota bacterium]
MRIAGLDVGEKMIGVAISDESGAIAQPFKSIERDSGVLECLREFFREYGVEKIIVGMPFLLNGTEGSESRKTREFAREVEQACGLSVEFQDERLSTREAEVVLKNAAINRDKKRRAGHSIAAALILQKYLESYRR